MSNSQCAAITSLGEFANPYIKPLVFSAYYTSALSTPEITDLMHPAATRAMI